MIITVIGLGYVGLPLAVWLAEKGFLVHGYDLDQKLVATLKSGSTSLLETTTDQVSLADRLQVNLNKGRLEFGSKLQRTDGSDQVFIVTVGIPVAGETCDLRPFTGAIDDLVRVLGEKDLVLIRSTLVPGTMSELVLPRLRQAGFIPGENLALAYCPERLAEGSAWTDLDSKPRLVAAEDEYS